MSASDESVVLFLSQFTFTELYSSFLAHLLILNCAPQATFYLFRWFAAGTLHRTLAVDFHIFVQSQGNIPYCVPTAPAHDGLHFVVFLVTTIPVHCILSLIVTRIVWNQCLSILVYTTSS